MERVYFGEDDNNYDSFIRSRDKRSCIKQKQKQGKSKRQARKECNKEMGGGVIKRGLKKQALAVPRRSFLTLLSLNYRGIASRLQRAKTNQPAIYDKAFKKWVSLGGDRKRWENNIKIGGKKKPFFCGKKCKGKLKFDGDYTSKDDLLYNNFDNGNYFNVEPATTGTAAIVASASAILVPIIAIVGKSVASKQERLADEADKDLITAEGEAAAAAAAEGAATSSLVKNLMIGGSILAVVVIGGAIAMKVIKRKRG